VLEQGVPKIVDPEVRRTDLAEAVWRVIRRDGLARASVRNVAREAGLSMGSLRHYFATQSELLAFAMRLVTERVTARVRALDRSGDARDLAERVIAEVLPLDEDRQAEADVWFAFVGKAAVDPMLVRQRDEGYDLLRSVFADLVAALGVDRDAELQTERLYALVDGLAVHGVMRPGAIPPDRMRAVVRTHLRALPPPGDVH
jgi:AcrR family transcriptional regulator